MLTVVLLASSFGCLVVHDPTAQQSLRIEAYGANALRVRAVPLGNAFRDDLVSALVPVPSPAGAAGAAAGAGAAAPPCVAVSLGAGGTNFTSGNLRAEVSAAAGGLLSFWRVSDGARLLTEQSVRTLRPTVTRPPLPGFYALQLAFEPVAGERIFGLGQHKTGRLDNKGVKGGFALGPRNTEITIPVVHSSLGYALLFNLPAFGAVEYNDTGSFWRADAALQADIWVATTADSPPHAGAAGSPWAQLQLAYADATGHAPALPGWATGFWQCKNRYKNRTQLTAVVDGYVARQHPVSLMIIDYYSWNPGPLGDEVLPPACWPDARSMVAELRAEGVELMISPYFHSLAAGSRPYAQVLKITHSLVISPSSTLTHDSLLCSFSLSLL